MCDSQSKFFSYPREPTILCQQTRLSFVSVVDCLGQIGNRKADIFSLRHLKKTGEFGYQTDVQRQPTNL